MRKALALAVASALVLASCRHGEPAVAPAGPSSERLTLHPLDSVDGAPNGYAEYVPPGYGDGKRRPLLVYFHGAGENGDGREAQLERILGNGIPRLIRSDRWPESRPFVVLMPQHAGGYEPGTLCPDAAEIRKFLAFALGRYAVDRRRVYVTGLSCGAIGLWYYLAAHTNEVVAAAVLIAGDGNPAVAEAGCAVARVPIWVFHGSYDSVVSVYGSIRPDPAAAAVHESAAGRPAPHRLRRRRPRLVGPDVRRLRRPRRLRVVLAPRAGVTRACAARSRA